MTKPSEIIHHIRRIAKPKISPNVLHTELLKFFDDEDSDDLMKIYKSNGSLTPTDIRKKMENYEEYQESEQQLHDDSDAKIRQALKSVDNIQSQYPKDWGEGNVKLKMLEDIYPKLIGQSNLSNKVKEFIDHAEKIMNVTHKKINSSQLDKLMTMTEKYTGNNETLQIVSKILQMSHEMGIMNKYMKRIKSRKDVEQGTYIDMNENRYTKTLKNRILENWSNIEQSEMGPDYYEMVDNARKGVFQSMKNLTKLQELVDDPTMETSIRPWMFEKITTVSDYLEAVCKTLEWEQDKKSKSTPDPVMPPVSDAPQFPDRPPMPDPMNNLGTDDFDEYIDF